MIYSFMNTARGRMSNVKQTRCSVCKMTKTITRGGNKKSERIMCISCTLCCMGGFIRKRVIKKEEVEVGGLGGGGSCWLQPWLTPGLLTGNDRASSQHQESFHLVLEPQRSSPPKRTPNWAILFRFTSMTKISPNAWTEHEDKTILSFLLILGSVRTVGEWWAAGSDISKRWKNNQDRNQSHKKTPRDEFGLKASQRIS